MQIAPSDRLLVVPTYTLQTLETMNANECSTSLLANSWDMRVLFNNSDT